jgi:hypothetical protein
MSFMIASLLVDCLIADRYLLHGPSVAVRIAEEDEGVPLSASPLNTDTAVHVLDRTCLHAPLDQTSPGALDVGDDELQALQHPQRHVQDPGAQVDRAARSGRSQLDEAHPVAELGIEVDAEADLLAVEGLRAIHVGDGNRDYFELLIYGALSFGAVAHLKPPARPQVGR